MRVLLLASLILTTGLAHATGLLAVIIDDIGNNAEVASAVLALPPGVTLSILPRLSASHQAAEAASRLGHEVMLHQPMESLNHRALGPGGLTLDHTRIDLEMVLAANLRSVPHAVGVNNHMGSLLTSMHWLMEALLRHGGLFFVDSRTNPRSVAQSTAYSMGIASARRDVFLDNIRNPDRIRECLYRAARLARLKGSAIAIGHPYPETLEVLRHELPRLREQGIELQPVSRVITYQRNSKTWHASSSPLPQVAKSSKP